MHINFTIVRTLFTVVISRALVSAFVFSSILKLLNYYRAEN